MCALSVVEMCRSLRCAPITVEGSHKRSAERFLNIYLRHFLEVNSVLRIVKENGIE